MTTTTQPSEPEMGLTFEKVWTMFQESDRRIQKLSEETAQQMRETDRQMKKTDEQLGKLGNRFGELAEHLVAPNIIEKFNALGFHFNDIAPGQRKIIMGEDNQTIAEFDILMENGESSVAVEVKSKPSGQDVKDHMRRLGIFRHYKDTIGDKRKIYGALAGAIMTDDVKTFILKSGLYVITQTGDTVKIHTPEGFIPKAW